MEYEIKPIFWDEVEPECETYDEAFLASLRAELKERETNGAKAASILLDPRFYSGKGNFWACEEKKDASLFELFTAAMLHAARRIKDCAAIAGFMLPDFQSDWENLAQAGLEDSCVQSFKAAFAKKHGHYEFVRRR